VLILFFRRTSPEIIRLIDMSRADTIRASVFRCHYIDFFFLKAAVNKIVNMEDSLAIKAPITVTPLKLPARRRSTLFCTLPISPPAQFGNNEFIGIFNPI
jgi:hypothetical protein